jgi:hypothetical protein
MHAKIFIMSHCCQVLWTLSLPFLLSCPKTTLSYCPLARLSGHTIIPEQNMPLISLSLCTGCLLYLETTCTPASFTWITVPFLAVLRFELRVSYFWDNCLQPYIQPKLPSFRNHIRDHHFQMCFLRCYLGVWMTLHSYRPLGFLHHIFDHSHSFVDQTRRSWGYTIPLFSHCWPIFT